MTDTAQPFAAAESETAPADPVADAAEAFKVHLGQAEPAKGEGEEIEAGDEADAPGSESRTGDEPPAESLTGEEEGPGSESRTGEAAAEAQPSDADLPVSWPSEKAELWRSLPPEARAYIAARDGQRDAAVNAKFQEAANLRKAQEAALDEAHASRLRYAEGLDQVLSLIRPHWPSPTMLDSNSDDYDPDEYHLRRAHCEEQQGLVEQLSRQRQTIAAQAREDEARAAVARFQQINAASRDAFIALVPDVADQAKAPAIFTGLMDYAIRQGAPADLFETPTTALEWAVLWKAKEYDRLQSAKALVGKDPVPAPRRAQPAVRPGVTTSRSAIEQARRSRDFGRLASEGSVEAGAAMWKHFLKQE
jgi:hypothetical protein